MYVKYGRMMPKYLKVLIRESGIEDSYSKESHSSKLSRQILPTIYILRCSQEFAFASITHPFRLLFRLPNALAPIGTAIDISLAFIAVISSSYVRPNLLRFVPISANISSTLALLESSIDRSRCRILNWRNRPCIHVVMSETWNRRIVTFLLKRIDSLRHDMTLSLKFARNCV